MTFTLSTELIEPLLDRGYIPTPLLKAGINHLCRRRLSKECFTDREEVCKAERDFIRKLDENEKIASNTEEANEQHYEVPSRYFELVLGKHLKYSCCLFQDDCTIDSYESATLLLDKAEEDMLKLYVERSGLKDGMTILDIGCGWGSFSLYVAKRFPKSKILSVSNSNTQREYISAKAPANVSVVTCDINNFKPKQKFDRIVSIEMLEHVRSHRRLFSRISDWLEPNGKFFCQVFSHTTTPYFFDMDKDGDNWMAKHFFSGGVMPSHDLFLHFQDDLVLDERWFMNGRNYGKTAECWLKKHDANAKEITEILGPVMFQRWRIFHLAVMETFSFDKGNQWGVSHYVFHKR